MLFFFDIKRLRSFASGRVPRHLSEASATDHNDLGLSPWVWAPTAGTGLVISESAKLCFWLLPTRILGSTSDSAPR